MAEATVDTPRVNGNVVSWGSCYYKYNGQRFYGIVECTYGESRERVQVAGSARSQAPGFESAGEYKCAAQKIKMLKHTAAAFRAALAAGSEDGVSYGNVRFEGVYQFIEPGLDPQTVESHLCTYKDLNASAATGGDPLYDEIGIQPRYLVINGKTLFDATEGMP